MSLQGTIRRTGSRTARLAWPLGVAVAIAIALGPIRGQAQSFAPTPPSSPAAPAPAPTPAPTSLSSEASPSEPGTVVLEPGVGVPVLPPNIQVVRFRVPEGAHVEVLGPAPEPINFTAATGPVEGVVGLKVGVGYRLRLWDLPGRPDAELFPVIEVVGHLHRPAGMDPVKFPIQVHFSEDDFLDAVDHGRLVTQVVYLEDPEQALPISLPKGEIPIVTLTPSEDPLRVGAALGRVMAIMRIGGRKPSLDELNGERIYGPGMVPSGPDHCPFSGSDGGACKLPCGPVRGTPPPPGRPWIPRDEYLCDGGDHAEPAHFGGDGGLLGIDPRDAVIQFSDAKRPRILPTNMVCVYAPRFAEVRLSVGPNEALAVEGPRRAEIVEAQAALMVKQDAKRLVKNEAAEASRHRARASGMASRVFAGAHSEIRVLNGFSIMTHIAGARLVQGPEQSSNRQKTISLREDIKALGIKTAESAVVTGIVEGAGQTVMTWTPRETVGVEEPPKKPGLAVIKRVSAGEAEQGDTLTFVIQFRNMGNTPIRSVSVIDSLLPRFGYVTGSSEGPKGTVFTAGENKVGSTELRWDLPGSIAPGVEGFVTFKAVVR
ncbi:conserved repeat domain-containing protein [Singulisphaera sp. GP187]|uniref:DUF11 domain-containing protein n=1 Tax=Singulisphaera sp. GP187 TaxID=1882752 RepID=UPI00092C42D3|nr:DUF11 domain-containing protein [Singulisphaera sp. GP187]SIN76141.1 conserved repeat domain-containing protein [Singulisphaera sp. GP187]